MDEDDLMDIYEKYLIDTEEIHEEEVTQCYICFTGAEFISHYINKDYGKLKRIELGNNGFVNLIKYADGIFQVNIDNTLEGHSYILVLNNDGIKSISNYGGLYGFYKIKISREEYIERFLNSLNSIEDYSSFLGIPESFVEKSIRNFSNVKITYISIIKISF